MMKEYRKVDDNIMLRMNTTDTHSEAGCAEFFKQLADAYQKREDSVNYCLKVSKFCTSLCNIVMFTGLCCLLVGHGRGTRA
jgi:Caffeine-induced death protein 2